jgi:glycosyltransferase involved in cell wall biosynthesis
VPPGVDVRAFRPRSRREALLEAAASLDADPDADRGRPDALDAEVAAALARRDAAALDEMASRYDQEVPDPGAARTLRELAERDRPLAGSFGKLIPQKGVAHLLVAAAATRTRPDVAVVGFGTHREWLQALAYALATTDGGAVAWLATRLGLEDAGAAPAALRTAFTGRLDHRYAPGALAAMDVLVVPSILEEAFGMVTAEGAAAGALPLVARHSGLAEVAAALEADVGRPELFSFAPGPGAVRTLTAGLDRLLGLGQEERAELRTAVHASVARRWSWEATANRLVAAATGRGSTAEA